MSHAKGDRRERELVNELEEGFAVMRAPASGAATDRELPDVLAGDGEVFYAIEAKSSSGKPIYLSGEEVEALIYFAQNFGAKPESASGSTARTGISFILPTSTSPTAATTASKGDGDRRGRRLPEFVGRSEKVTLEQIGDADDGPDEEILRVLNAVEQGVMDVEEAAELLE